LTVSRGFISFVLGVAVSAVFFVAGCGGGDSAPSKAEFLEEGNAICVKGEKERTKLLLALGRKYGNNASMSSQEKAIIELLSTYELTSEELGDLGPPEGDEDAVDQIIEAREEATEKVKADPATAIAGTTQFERADELAKGFGLDRCSVS
jgi:hypothetical protein